MSYCLTVRKLQKSYCRIEVCSVLQSTYIYKYGKVGFAPKENADGTLPMKFDYDVLFNPHETDLDKQEFIDYIGDILIEQLDKQIKNGTAVFDK